MGELYQVKCNLCDYKQEISEGAGKRAIITNYYCADCGLITADIVDWQREALHIQQQNISQCPTHANAKMKRLANDKHLPCTHCQVGTCNIRKKHLARWD